MLNFSIAYGKTAHGLSRDWGTSLKEAQDTVDRWYADRPEVRHLSLQGHGDCSRKAHRKSARHSVWGSHPRPYARRLPLLWYVPVRALPLGEAISCHDQEFEPCWLSEKAARGNRMVLAEGEQLLIDSLQIVQERVRARHSLQDVGEMHAHWPPLHTQIWQEAGKDAQ